MNKKFAILLILILTASSLIAIVAVQASTTKPIIPEFIVKFEKHSSDKPAVYQTNPYNGKQEESSPARHYEWETISLIIKNQPFEPYQIKAGNITRDITLYYNVHHKGHFEDTQSYFSPDFYRNQSTGDFTEIVFFVGVKGPNGDIMPGGQNVLQQPVPTAGDQVDFQVEALIGYVEPGGELIGIWGYQWRDGTFNGTESGWSETQTATIGEKADSATLAPSTPPSPSSTPPEQNVTHGTNYSVTFTLSLDAEQLAILALLSITVVLLVVVVVSIRGKKHKIKSNVKFSKRISRDGRY